MSQVVGLEDVVVRYGARVALDAVSLTVRRGERVALLGPSGAGKSTMLGVAAGLVAPASGAVHVLGEDLATLRGRRRRRVQARVGSVHQNLDLVGPLAAVHNVNAGRLGDWSPLRALCSLVRPLGVDDARAALSAVGLADRMADRTDSLSGGQQQRVAVARVLVQRPVVVLADEPVSALDPALADEVMRLLVAAVEATDGALVAALHDVVLARRWCDRVVGLAAGRVRFDLPACEVGDDDLAELFATGAR